MSDCRKRVVLVLLEEGVDRVLLAEGSDVVLGAVVIALAVGHEPERVHAVPRGATGASDFLDAGPHVLEECRPIQVFEWYVLMPNASAGVDVAGERLRLAG